MGDAAQRFLAGVPANEADDPAQNALLHRVRTWAAEQDDQDLRAVAARAAVRFLNADTALEESDKSGQVPLSCFRCGITACVGAVHRDEPIIAAAQAAANDYAEIIARLKPRFGGGRTFGTTKVIVSYGACLAVGHPPFEYALRAIFFRPRAIDAGSYEATLADMKVTEQQEGPTSLFRHPLWQGAKSTHPGHDIGWEYFRRFPERWRFWTRWYDSLMTGEPLDWDLQREVALIPDDDWKKGPEHIARLIAEIEARFLAEKLPQAEDVEFNPETGLFRTVPRPPEKPDLLAATLVQVGDALDDALANPSNGLTERSRETRVIRRALTRYGNDPQQIEMSMVSAHRSLTRQIVEEELPPSEENIALQEAAAACARGVRAAHPEIAENRRILDSQALAELSTEDKAKLEEARPVLEAISEPDLASEWVEDIPAIVAEGTGPPRKLGPTERNPILAAYDEKVRTFSRTAKVSLILRSSGEALDKVCERTGLSRGEVISIFLGLVSIGISLL